MPTSFTLNRCRAEIAVRAAILLLVVASVGIAAWRNRVITQMNVANFLAEKGWTSSYAIYGSQEAAISSVGKSFANHARYSLVEVTVTSIDNIDEATEQLSRLDTLRVIRIEYISGGGCGFTIFEHDQAIQRLKNKFPNATVEVKVTTSFVVG